MKRHIHLSRDDIETIAAGVQLIDTEAGERLDAVFCELARMGEGADYEVTVTEG